MREGERERETTLSRQWLSPELQELEKTVKVVEE
jgi:hypothetical protein